MHFRYSAPRIYEIARMPKCLSSGKSLATEGKGEHGAVFDEPLDPVDGAFLDLRFLGKATDLSQVESYDSSLLLDQRRVRGIGYTPVGRENFRAKRRISKGWHQNICDPNRSTLDPDFNRHEPLPNFAPKDFADFILQSAQMWAIDLNWETPLL